MKINILQTRNQETIIVIGSPPTDLTAYTEISIEVGLTRANGYKVEAQETISADLGWEEGRLTIPSLDLLSGSNYSYKIYGDSELLAYGKLTITDEELPSCSTGTSTNIDEYEDTLDSCADTNFFAGLPSVGVPSFMAPYFISGEYMLSPEDGYRQLIATDETTIIVPASSRVFSTGWYCYVVKRTQEIVKFVPESEDISSIYSVDNSREILEVNGTASICLTEHNGWHITGGLA